MVQMKKMTEHIEVPIKTAAWADSQIAPLVEALNELPNIWTTNGGEGYGESGHVYFAYRGSLDQFTHFVRDISVGLSKLLPDGRYRIKIEWVAGGEMPRGALIAHREVILPLSKAIRKLAFSHVRKNPGSHGNRGTRLHNLANP
jgi:hypothetical protein